jgi:hypothetical protein
MCASIQTARRASQDNMIASEWFGSKPSFIKNALSPGFRHAIVLGTSHAMFRSSDMPFTLRNLCSFHTVLSQTAPGFACYAVTIEHLSRV